MMSDCTPSRGDLSLPFGQPIQHRIAARFQTYALDTRGASKAGEDSTGAESALPRCCQLVRCVNAVRRGLYPFHFSYESLHKFSSRRRAQVIDNLVRRAIAVLAACFFPFAFPCARSYGQVDVLTLHNNSSRTGANLRETRPYSSQCERDPAWDVVQTDRR